MLEWLRTSARFLFGKCLPRLAYPVIKGPLRGARFILGALAGEGGGATAYFNMLEAEQTSAFSDTLKNGQVFFDIGANVGYYSILGSRLVGPEGRVVAFEPLIRNLVYLYKHTVLNKSKNVTIISAACSDTLSLTAFSYGPTFAEGSISSNNSLIENYLLVPTITVDSVVQRSGLSPDVIKIDVEGAEMLVLAGAQTTIRESKPKIFLSTHSDALRTDCLEYLTKLGYTTEVLSPDKSNPSEFLAKHAGE